MIPVVDISCCTGAGHPVNGDENPDNVKNGSDIKEATMLLHNALIKYGFCYLSNHGIPQSVIDEFLRISKTFFMQPTSTKERYARTAEAYDGYNDIETERLNAKRPEGDAKEAFNFIPSGNKSFPSEVPEMGPCFKDLFDRCVVLVHRVLDILGVALDLEDPGYLRKCHQTCGQRGNSTTLRTAYYPPCTNLKEGQIQCGEHSDYGSITLLFQDDVGGLQILGKDGEYHDVKPVPGTVVINLGDVVQRWTANKYPATKHRVIVPRQAAEEGRARQSAAFFCVPDEDTLITCLDGSDTYPPITVAEFYAQLMLGSLY